MFKNLYETHSPFATEEILRPLKKLMATSPERFKAELETDYYYEELNPEPRLSISFNEITDMDFYPNDDYIKFDISFDNSELRILENYNPDYCQFPDDLMEKINRLNQLFIIQKDIFLRISGHGHNTSGHITANRYSFYDPRQFKLEIYPLILKNILGKGVPEDIHIDFFL